MLILETNLMWTSRLSRSMTGLGHEPEVAGELPDELCFDAAILNLAELDREVVQRLTEARVVTIGHAGHKEKELHELGRAMGCDILATNSELTFKLEALLEKAAVMRTALG